MQDRNACGGRDAGLQAVTAFSSLHTDGSVLPALHLSRDTAYGGVPNTSSQGAF